MKNYLKEKITNWYKNAKEDYEIEGKFVDVNTEGNTMVILFEEDGEPLKTTICYYEEYSAEQIYNIWMEMGADEE